MFSVAYRTAANHIIRTHQDTYQEACHQLVNNISFSGDVVPESNIHICKHGEIIETIVVPEEYNSSVNNYPKLSAYNNWCVEKLMEEQH